MSCVMKKTEFGGESDTHLSGKGWTDTTDFNTVGKTTHDFPKMVNSIRGCISHGWRAVSLQRKLSAFSLWGDPL